MVPPSEPPFLTLASQVPLECQARRRSMGPTPPPPPWAPSSQLGLITSKSPMMSAICSLAFFKLGFLSAASSVVLAANRVPAPRVRDVAMPVFVRAAERIRENIFGVRSTSDLRGHQVCILKTLPKATLHQVPTLPRSDRVSTCKG